MPPQPKNAARTRPNQKNLDKRKIKAGNTERYSRTLPSLLLHRDSIPTGPKSQRTKLRIAYCSAGIKVPQKLLPHETKGKIQQIFFNFCVLTLFNKEKPLPSQLYFVPLQPLCAHARRTYTRMKQVVEISRTQVVMASTSPTNS